MQNKLSLFSPRNLVIYLAVFAGLVAIVARYAEPVLRISIIPGEPPVVVNRKMKLLTDYLEQKIGMKVEFRPKRSGDALVESLLFKELDLVWIDDARLAQARSRSNDGVLPIVRRVEDLRAATLSDGTPPDAVYRWAVRAGLDAKLRQKLTEAFLTMNMDADKGMGILLYQRTSRFVAARAEDGSIDGVSERSVAEQTVPGRPLPR